MDDAPPERLVEGIGQLSGDRHRLIERKWALLETRRERLAVEVRHHQEVDAVGVADVVDAADMRMVERRYGAGFALEPTARIGICGQLVRQHFDRYGPIEPGIVRPIHLTHAAGAEGRQNLVGTQTSAGRESHAAGR